LREGDGRGSNLPAVKLARVWLLGLTKPPQIGFRKSAKTERFNGIANL
jgi:hypothetical protein